MKKILPIFIVGILVFGGLGAVAFKSDNSMEKTMISKSDSSSLQFSSKPILYEREDAVKIEINGATSQLIEPNKPVLPICIKTYQLPIGSKNIKVTCTPKDIGTMTLTKKIMSARIAPLSKMKEIKTSVKDNSVYSSAAFYPNKWYSVNLGAGRDYNGKEVIFVKVICYPVRYSPANNQVDYAARFDVAVTYDAPTTPPQTLDAYDMVIIAPKSFESKLQPLIDFKNTKGLKTTFKSVEDIFSEYTGADPPEQVKYFIKYAYDTWGIKYVMLVGGLKSHIIAQDKDARSYGSTAWWVPVRYVSIPQEDDEGCLSDLYYGCLYNATGGFDSWDSSGDHVYANWGWQGGNKDKFDMYPEVYVSRLPCTTVSEVNVVVNKILTYESTGPAAKPWYKTFIGIGGKTFANYSGKPDGEYLCDLAYSYVKNAIPDLNQVKVYSTNRDTGGLIPSQKDIPKAITPGAGFVDFEGHGFPLGWNTIWFWGTHANHNWVGGLILYNFTKVSNGDKLPVVIVGGCHNALYNVSVIPGIIDTKGTSYFVFGYPCPVCFSWGLVVKPRGGAIASTGCTGYGMGDNDYPVSLSGALEENFFWQIGNNSVTNLAKAHSQAITKYINEHTILQIDAFVITNWALLGDPSLRFGGYSS
ncbi:MAG: C25 family cysteine peptidase [Euryarchaeota archaeon]|nr:C25 family cysteine peptidase [Euryarchaeota archaeon]